MNRIIKFISSYIEDFFMFTGILIFILSTYEINTIAGNYLLAIVFIFIGIILSKRHPQRE